MTTHAATMPFIHDTVVHAWQSGQDQTLYRIIDVNSNGTVTVRKTIMETTFDPRGSEQRLREFLAIYVS